MARQREPYSLIRRPKTEFWYYRLPSMAGYRSTGRKRKADALAYVDGIRAREHESQDSLGQWAADFWLWGRCPHVTRLRAEGRRISPNHCVIQRGILERYVLPDVICKLPIADVRRGDILKYRQRLLEDIGRCRTLQKATGIVKTILKEAYFHEIIDRDPTVGIGKVAYDKQAVGTFTAEELRRIFGKRPGVWRDLSEYCAFFLPATTGMRRSEVLDLTWGQVDFEGLRIAIDRARTDDGLPKWGRVRTCPLPTVTAGALRELRAESRWVLPHQRVFCYVDGEPYGESWWAGRFKATMAAAGFMTKGKGRAYRNPRNLRPHSFRHSINTLLLDAGYDAEKVRAAIGWSDAAVQKGYTHTERFDTSGQGKIIDGIFR